MKYIMILNKNELTNVKIPVIFPDMLNHDQMAESVLHNLGMNHNLMCKVISAGFIKWDSDEVYCYGKSETLKMESDKNDAAIINSYDYLHGIS